MIPEALLAAFVRAPVPRGEARAVMALSVLDWAACGLAGQGEPVASILRGQALDEGAAAGATLFGGGRTSLSRAALVNGATSHALDYDDTHFAHIGHTSVAVLPAALAMAEHLGADFSALLDAALIGAEAAVRIGQWLGRDHYQTGFHQTATSGAFGAVLAVARLAGLTEEQTVAAMGLAATRAAGLKSQFGTMGKPYNAGLAAQTGIEAVQLAQAGMTSSAQGLSGPQGFGPTHHGADDAAAWDGLGEAWRFAAVHHKFHACCHGLHAMLEALGEVAVDPESVAKVQVRTHPRWLSVCNIAAPASGLEAKFSYRLTAAMRLSGRDTGNIATFSDHAAAEPALRALREKVSVLADESLTEMQAGVEITLQSGRRIALAHDLGVALPLEVRRVKVLAKAVAIAGAKAEALISAVEGGDLTALVAVIGGQAQVTASISSASA